MRQRSLYGSVCVHEAFLQSLCRLSSTPLGLTRLALVGHSARAGDAEVGGDLFGDLSFHSFQHQNEIVLL